MAAISQQIPNLLGGVSQQPDSIKLPGQVKEAINAYLDPTFGCSKRPPTKFIAKLGNDVPSYAKWIPIFRDTKERYVMCLYNSGTDVLVRVWDTSTGVERTVTVSNESKQYLSAVSLDNINALTINDYTFIANSERVVSMSGSSSAASSSEALVILDTISYNTNYAIDFINDGATTQVKKYRAKAITISPGSYEVEDAGVCTQNGAQTFSNLSGGTGGIGLGFRVVNQCAAYLRTDNIFTVSGVTAITTSVSSSAAKPAAGTYTVSRAGSSNIVVSLSYTSRSVRTGFTTTTATVTRVSGGSDWPQGSRGVIDHPTTPIIFEIVGSTSTSTRYVSKYTCSASLINGGENWRVGDKVTVTVNGKSFEVTVTEEDFVYTYATGGSAVSTTPVDATGGMLTVGSVVADLVTKVNAIANFAATGIGNVVHIRRTDGRDFGITTRGGVTNKALYAIKNSVNDVSRLPVQCIDGYILKVANLDQADGDDYYVKFVSDTAGIPGTGSWEETVKPGISISLNSSTMPQALIRLPSGNFELRSLSTQYSDTQSWAQREVGDDTTNPIPSFVGKSISNMFFFANRFGVLSGDTVVMTQPGDYFNFFNGSAIAVSEADSIDLAASATKSATLMAAVGTSTGLVLFSQNVQFLLSSQDATFSTSTAKLTELSNYTYNATAMPVDTGISVAFPSSTDTATHVFEMAVNSAENRPQVASITRAVPTYLPSGMKFSSVSPNNSLFLFGDQSNSLYVFSFFNSGNERNLAGWSKWTYPGRVLLHAFDRDTSFAVIEIAGRPVLVRSELRDNQTGSPVLVNGQGFDPRLDLYSAKASTTIVASSTTSKVYLPAGAYDIGLSLCVIFTGGDYSGTYEFPAVLNDGMGYYFVLDNDLVASDFYVGVTYEFSLLLPSFYVTTQDRSDKINSPVVESVYIDTFYTGLLTASIDRKGYDQVEIDLDNSPADTALANSPLVEEINRSVVHPYCLGRDLNITIKSSTPLPVTISSYGWTGHYNNRGVSIIR
jgi:hypothetical protein